MNLEKTPSSIYKIRFSDCDLFGHLNNARYIDYFLNAREDHLKEAYDLELTNYHRQGLAWLVGSHEISYIKPAFYNENVIIQTSLLQVKDEFLLAEMQMMDEKQSHLKAHVWTKFIPVNVKTGKRENHPASFMEFARSIQHEGNIQTKSSSDRVKDLLACMKTGAFSEL